MTPQRVEEILSNWACWMRHARSPGRLSSRASSGIIGSSHTDFEEMCGQMDQSVARATDAIIDDMQGRLRSAVYAIELGCSWLFEGEPDECYLLAVGIIGERLDRIGIT